VRSSTDSAIVLVMRIGRFVAGVGIASVFTWSTGVALRHGISEPEAAVFRWFNDGLDDIETPVWALTQAGSLGSVVVTAGVVGHRRGSREGLVVLVLGSGVWTGVKLIKPLVGRGRPDRYLDRVELRGRPQNGLGYPSGHAAVSMTLALIAPRRLRSRMLAVTLASLVGCGRVYQGAHLPLDVTGGLAIGAATGLAANAARSAAAGARRG
jgi:membrane-associated phospholipid phosphatase